jgi:formylglycine-generating enzyme required for sulfatase activity
MNDTYSAQDDAQSLREQLARVRAEAEEELESLRRDLVAVRELAHPARDVDRATEDVAVWQEVDSLRKALREKERLIDSTAAQCRRLEDELEDHHQAYDGLKQNLERNKLLLAETRDVAASLSREREELEGRLAFAAAASDGVPPLPLPRKPVFGDRRFLAGLLAGGLLAGLVLAAALAVRPGLWSAPTPRAQTMTAGDSASQVDGTAPAAAAPDAAVDPPETVAKRPAVGAEALPVEARTRRDQLRGGAPGPLMILISGGAYTMGTPRTLPTDNDGPAHQVHLGAFLIGATEVTFADYDRFARTAGRRLPRDFGWGRGRRPVVDVSWSDAAAYVQWLSGQTGKAYRLPSEAEWEYVARAGQPSTFWWGYRKGSGRAVCFDCGTPWDNRSTVPVASFAPNPFGLYDTAGNVMEWVADCYHKSYQGAPADGRPWEEPGCGARVARGGAFNKPADSMRSSARHAFAPGTRINLLGFRVARDE